MSRPKHDRQKAAEPVQRTLDSFSDEIIAVASRDDRLAKWTARPDFGPLAIEGLEQISKIFSGPERRIRAESIAECARLMRESTIALHPEFDQITQYWAEKEAKLAVSKYAFTGETKRHWLHIGIDSRDTKTVVLNQIEALRDIPRHGVRAGDLGGWIESEANLSQDGAAWIDPKVRLWGAARVSGDAALSGHIELSGDIVIGSGVPGKPPEMTQGVEFDAANETAQLEQFYSEHLNLINALGDACEEKDVYGDDLDELAHDAGGGLLDGHPDDADAVSQWISDGVNNRGLEFQIAFILRENGLEEGEAMLRARFDEVAKSATTDAPAI